MFTRTNFKIFDDVTLAGRMDKIKTIIDLQFISLAQVMQPEFNRQHVTMYSHVAKHLRRTVNPPVDTWIAFGPHRRGYKKDPHIEVGLWPDCLFIWLVVLLEAKQDSQTLTQEVVRSEPMISRYGDQWQISNDHTTPEGVVNTSNNLHTTLTRFQQLKSTEFVIGKVWSKADPLFDLPEAARMAVISKTMMDLLPLYQRWNRALK